MPESPRKPPIFHPDFTGRNVAKYVAQAAIQQSVAKVVKGVILDHSSFDDDNIAVKIGANVIGWIIADQAKPVTTAAVDKTFNFVNAKREARKEKKAAKTQQEALPKD